jgi:hypothetical protein
VKGKRGPEKHDRRKAATPAARVTSPPPEQKGAALSSPVQASRLPPEIPPLVRRSLAAFRKALPQSLQVKERWRQWVAYRDDECLGFSASGTDLYNECLGRGLKKDEFVVCCIIPDIPPEVDAVPLWGV